MCYCRVVPSLLLQNLIFLDRSGRESVKKIFESKNNQNFNVIEEHLTFKLKNNNLKVKILMFKSK